VEYPAGDFACGAAAADGAVAEDVADDAVAYADVAAVVGCGYVGETECPRTLEERAGTGYTRGRLQKRSCAGKRQRQRQRQWQRQRQHQWQRQHPRTSHAVAPSVPWPSWATTSPSTVAAATVMLF